MRGLNEHVSGLVPSAFEMAPPLHDAFEPLHAHDVEVAEVVSLTSLLN